MDINVSQCASVRSQLSETAQAVKSSYESEWNDAVHESFHGYIEEYDSEAQNIEGILGEFEALAEELQDINMEELSQQCEALESRVR